MREIKFKYIYQHTVNRDFKSEVFTLDNIANWKANSGYKLENFLTEEGYKFVARVQYTGLNDKQGVEIYEYMEIDNQYEVQFINGCYVLINISNDDIITLSTYLRNNDGKATVTKEYTKV